MVAIKRVAVWVVFGSAMGVVFGGCVAQSPVIGEEGQANGSDGSVELIGSATYFVKTVVSSNPSGVNTCLPRTLPLGGEGDVQCALYHVSNVAGGDCSCPNGGQVLPAAFGMIEDELEAKGLCGGQSGVDCEDYCVCLVPPAEGDAATDCLNNQSPAESSVGWCYINPSLGRGSDEFVADCPETMRGTIRILPENAAGATENLHVISCLGGPVVLGPTAPGPGALGAPCYPGIERNHDFNGFSLTELSFEFGSPDCESNTCLVNHFQGRVSCPYGQPAEPDPNYPACPRPGLDGQVTVPVDPQLLERLAEDHVICSCRCDGPDPSDSYCDCPSDMECAPLVPYSDVPNTGSYVGSYCIPRGTRYDLLHPPGVEECTLERMNCR